MGTRHIPMQTTLQLVRRNASLSLNFIIKCASSYSEQLKLIVSHRQSKFFEVHICDRKGLVSQFEVPVAAYSVRSLAFLLLAHDLHSKFPRRHTITTRESGGKGVAL